MCDIDLEWGALYYWNYPGTDTYVTVQVVSPAVNGQINLRCFDPDGNHTFLASIPISDLMEYIRQEIFEPTDVMPEAWPWKA